MAASLRVVTLASILALGSATFAHAETAQDPATAAATVRSRILEADSAAGPDRFAAVEDAAYQLAVIERLTKSADASIQTAAEAALRGLNEDGINADILTLWTVTGRMQRLLSLREPEAFLNAEIEIYEDLKRVRSPIYRAAIVAAVGRTAVSLKDHSAARRAAERLAPMLSEVSEVPERAAVANSTALIAASYGGLADPLVVKAIGAIQRPRDRAQTWHIIARDTLAGDALAAAELDALETGAKDALAGGLLERAMQLTFAIAPKEEKRRAELLTALLKVAADAGNDTVAQRVALAFTDADDQKAAVRGIVDRLVAGEEPVRAVAVIDNLLTGPARASALLVVANRLAAAGYATGADTAFERAIASARGDDAATAEVARGLANAKRLEQAKALAADLQPGRGLSRANGAIAKSLSDEGRIGEAEALLPSLTEKDDRSNALSGIARAKARAGDVEGASAVIADLTDEEHRDRVYGAIVDAYAKKGDFTASRAAAQSIASEGERLEAHLDIVRRSAKQNDAKIMRLAVGDAIEIARNAQGDERDEHLVEIVEAQVSAGDIDGAKAVLDSITGEKARDKARAEVTKGLARKKRSAEAGELRQKIASAELRDRVLADLAADRMREDQDKSALFGEIQTIADSGMRRAAFRRAAEAATEKLDVLGKLNNAAPPVVDASASAVLGSSDPAKNGIEISAFNGAPSKFRAMEVPRMVETAADVRTRVPLGGSGRADLALTTDNRYFGKFFEDLPGGVTGMDQTERAQGLAAPTYILITGGAVSLGELENRFADAVRREGDAVIVRKPILIAPGAALVVSGLETKRVRLSADAGAFLINAGALYITDSEILGWSEAAGQPLWHTVKDSKSFRPFILSWSASETFVGGAHLTALGYAAPKSFGFSISAGPTDIDKIHGEHRPPRGIVADNTFENFEYGFYSYEAEDVRLVGNEYRNNVIYGVDPHDRSVDLKIAYNTVYGTEKKHGIIVSREVDRSFIVGNVTFANHGSGFMLDRDSTGNIVYANSAFQNVQDGLTLFESSCNLIVANHFHDNKRDGVKLRNSWDIGVYLNTLERNARSGIDGYVVNLRDTPDGRNRDYAMDPYAPVTTFSAGWNDITENGGGVSFAGVSGGALFDNAIRQPPKRWYRGDAVGTATQILSLGNRVAVRSVCRPKRPANACPLMEAGLMGDEGLSSFYDDAASGDCTDNENAVQGITFRRTRGDS